MLRSDICCVFSSIIPHIIFILLAHSLTQSRDSIRDVEIYERCSIYYLADNINYCDTFNGVNT